MIAQQLETSRLVLEPIGPEHARVLYPYVSDERLYAYVDDRPPESEASLEMRYRLWAMGRSPIGDETWLNWAARVRGENEYVGWFQSTVRSKDALIAYAVFVPFQRMGYAREACTAIIAHLQDAYHVTRIRATVDPRNNASIAVARSLGMTAVPSDSLDLLFELKVSP